MLNFCLNMIATILEKCRSYFGRLFDAVDPKIGMFVTSCFAVAFAVKFFLMPFVGGGAVGVSDKVVRRKDKK